MELNTKELAEELLLGRLDISDLIPDVEFLQAIDKSILDLAKDQSNWSGVLIANKRKQIIDKIAVLLNEQEEEDSVTCLQRANRTKRKRP